MRCRNLMFLSLLISSTGLLADENPAVTAQTEKAKARPSVLISTGRDWPTHFVDYRYLRELAAHGFQIEASEGTPLTWEYVRKFH